VRVRADAEEARYGEKPQLDDTSVRPLDRWFEDTAMDFEHRQELEGSPPQLTPCKCPAELRAGPYSNRHELADHNK
jgi:hypothetical protein